MNPVQKRRKIRMFLPVMGIVVLRISERAILELAELSGKGERE